MKRNQCTISMSAQNQLNMTPSLIQQLKLAVENLIMETGFLNKLYDIKPFRIVHSPESNKNIHSQSIQPHQQSLSNQYPPSNPRQQLNYHSPKLDKENRQPIVKITDPSLFTNLSSSIDNLFSKIQKIKMQFDCQQDKQFEKGSSANKSPYLKNGSFKKQGHSNSCENSNQSFSKIKDKTNQYECSPFLQENSNNRTITKKFSETSAYTDLDAINNAIHKTKSMFEKQSPIKLQFTTSHPQKQRISPFEMRQFQLGRCVGSGKFGDVHICRHKATNTIFALKKIFKSTIKEYNMVEQFIRQLKIHYILNNANIVKLYGFFEDDYHVFLLMEYAEGGTLYQKFLQNPKQPETKPTLLQKQVSKTIFQLLHSVSYLHRQNILHRDIKPQNIVISHNMIKLCDFGWSSIFNNEMKKTFCGTLDYLSPEMKDKGEYTTSVDLWSIGVLTFELLAGFGPFKNEIDKMRWKGLKKNENQIKGNKWNWDSITFPAFISDEARHFILQLLQEDPDKRPSIRECLRHQFIEKYNNMRIHPIYKIRQMIQYDLGSLLNQNGSLIILEQVFSFDSFLLLLFLGNIVYPLILD